MRKDAAELAGKQQKAKVMAEREGPERALVGQQVEWKAVSQQTVLSI